MSRRKKGLRSKKKARDFYEDLNWEIDDVESSDLYAKSKDLFGLFDLIGIKGHHVLFIQVKTNRPAKQQTYIDWAKEHCYENIHCEVYTWYDRNGPRIQRYRKDGSIHDVDLRMRKNKGKKVYKDLDYVKQKMVIR